MTIRAPLYTRYTPRQQPVDLLTWTNGVSRAPPTPKIQNQTDWPNPQPKPPNLELRSWVNQLPPGIIALPVPPIRNYDWQNPLPKNPDLTLRSWIWYAFPAIVPATPIQNRQNDWPNPQPQKANLELRSWVNSLPPGVIANPVPIIRNYDFPNPGIARRIDYTWAWSQQIPQPVVSNPFSQSDWPNPLQRKYLADYGTWVQNLPPGAIALTIPQGQHSWPDYFPSPPNLDLRTWLQTTLIANIGAPFYQTDWPNPRGPVYPDRTWLWTQQLQPVIVAAPFAQYDWPNPQIPRRLDGTWIGLTQLQPPPFVPFIMGQYDWPNPQIPRQAIDLRSWFNAVPPGTIIPAPPSFTQLNTPGRHRLWDTPEIEDVLSAETMIRTLWSEGQMSQKKRDKLLSQARNRLKDLKYGRRIK